MSEEDDMFARWSRRKRAVAAESAGDAPSDEAKPEISPDDVDEAALLKELKLPLPESLRAGDDFSIFMRAGVPGFLRRRALRVLWRSNPALANLDGLNDYDDDFTSPELTKKVVATGYKVGKGFLKELLAEDTQPQTVPDDPPVAESTATAEEDTEVYEDDTSREIAEHRRVDDEPDGSETETFRPRRMRFNL